MTLVSIIIVNYNGKRFLDECLSSIYSVSYSNYEVILVDNHSSDGSIDFVAEKFPDVIIKQLEQNFGFAKANNIGADIARGELLLFLNNDTKVTKGFLEPLVAEIQSNDTAICQSLLLKPDGKVDSAGDFVDKYGRAFSSRIIPEKTSPILSARGACMLVKKDIFWKLGGFDEKFFVSFEDVDLGWRAWITGYQVLIIPSSIVVHQSGMTVKRIQKEIKFHGLKNTMVLLLTNFEWRYAIYNIIKLLFVVSKIKLLNHDLSPTGSELTISYKDNFKILFWLIKNIRYLVTRKSQISKSRKISTKKLISLSLITQHRR